MKVRSKILQSPRNIKLTTSFKNPQRPTNQPPTTNQQPTNHKVIVLYLKVIKKLAFFNIDEFILIPFHCININEGYQNK